MDGIADMGGSDGWGPLRPPVPDEPVFAQPWQGRAFALALLANRASGGNTDSFRHTLERLDAAAYFDDGYYGRWLNGAERILDESGLLPRDAVRARARALRGDQVAQPAALPRQRRAPSTRPPGSVRRVDTDPVFRVGQPVRTKDWAPDGHTRLPRYARSRPGVIDRVRTAFVFPDTNAHFRGENPQYVYSVRFAAADLFGAGTDDFDVTLDLYESYLEARR
ncbi:nitrile hydratase subunit beta [Mycolicibacterium rufum]|uniref:Nitrile hydratase subunit beta n=1 Tax=Mycolicibacterium rufum TaxID=318424 RepID=A0ABY3U9B6_9MYCO|nr:nitrile hydratase subunit beta [Mycolicibacterium rufum]KGI69567.1 nitrile hydratase [Mycolicibacterium rufum]ULP35796.1 nitrile hydratase subunit beta [Mycolicibacterium rufum]